MTGKNELLIGKKVITDDAYILGDIMDYSCETVGWNIIGLRIKTNSSVAPMLNIGSGKSLILLQPGDFRMNDVVLLDDTVDSVRSKITPDEPNRITVKGIIGMKVYASDGLLVGTVESLDIDHVKWEVISMNIKLDKGAHQALEVKKMLFGKKISGIMMSQIDGIKDSVILSLDTAGIKDQMIVL